MIILLSSICCLVSSPLLLAKTSDNSAKQSQKQLDSLQKAISKEKQNIAKTNQARQTLEKQLKKDEIAIANNAKALNQTENQLKHTKQEIKTLELQQAQLEQQKRQQENLLAKQLRAAYTSGEHDYLKLLLNQEEPSKVQRSITYYQYLNDARIQEIEGFKTTISKLLEVVTQLQEQSAQLTKLQTRQKIQKNNLSTAKEQRAKTIAMLNKRLLSSQEKLAKLKAEEENLQIEIQRLARLAKQSPKLNGLKSLTKKLKWPVRGKVRHRFGSKKQGYLKWKGVLLSAPSGRTVNSVHHGKVLFSDWLKGYGLVTIVDHGKGYMSLYGHNQALLKSVGDTVKAGEAIALVGQSGGQSQSGLYFEIRYQGKALNPTKWCR